MFGGFGIYCDEKMFGLVSDSELFLKTDKHNISKFTELDLKPFTYQRKGKHIALSYYQAPALAIEDPDILLEWAELSIAAANRDSNKAVDDKNIS